MEGIYSTLTGSMALEARMRVVAHDLANINTAGHKRTRLIAGSIYPDIQADLIAQSDPAGLNLPSPTGFDNSGQALTTITGQEIDFSQGQIQLTGLETDLALEGEGFFNVEVGGETLYTRAGRFSRDADGQLVTLVESQWVPVLSDTGPIRLPAGDFMVSEDGTVTDGQGERAGVLTLTAFDSPQALERRGYTLFANPENAAALRPVEPGATRVLQGHLEGSNANPITSLVEMIEIQRAHQATAKAMTAIDEATGDRMNAANQ